MMLDVRLSSMTSLSLNVDATVSSTTMPLWLDNASTRGEASWRTFCGKWLCLCTMATTTKALSARLSCSTTVVVQLVDLSENVACFSCIKLPPSFYASITTTFDEPAHLTATTFRYPSIRPDTLVTVHVTYHQIIRQPPKMFPLPMLATIPVDLEIME